MNKTVFITGGNAGTGYGIAELFAREKWDVLISGRRKEEVDAAAKRLCEQYGIFSKDVYL